MNYTAIFGIGLLSFAFSGCLSQSDTHPDIPLLPQTDNARIRVDSLPDTAVHRFAFSADKTKIYAIVLTASTGVFAQHTLVEFDQKGHRLRQLPLGELSVQTTELALGQRDSLLWLWSDIFYVFDLKQFKVIDKLPAYWTGNYPNKDIDDAKETQESNKWLHQKQQALNQQFGIQKADSVTFAVLEGNKANEKAYRDAIRKVQNQVQMELVPTWSKAFYETYVLARIRSGQSSFGYRGADGKETYVFTRVTADSTAVFRLDESVIQKAGVAFHKPVVNPRVTIDQTKSRYTDSEGKSIVDKTSALRLTEELQTQHNDFLFGGSKMDQFLFYYELKIGAKTAHFKWVYPVKLSDDSYLQSANGTVFLVKENTLCWFHE
ncbi:hypothetical protein [Spirosoma gilvum]